MNDAEDPTQVSIKSPSSKCRCFCGSLQLVHRLRWQPICLQEDADSSFVRNDRTTKRRFEGEQASEGDGHV